MSLEAFGGNDVDGMCYVFWLSCTGGRLLDLLPILGTNSFFWNPYALMLVVGEMLCCWLTFMIYSQAN